ncbi:hypothetical protein [Thiohalocapsa sp. ML1]|jgi:hypothetical protein|uniref:hypothetical protein n=1 Tax=Thiohalocapsa sp. ML1 TaxID=1431688 RepID=UPI0007323F44|nr:hypothetical protein [Thiohalocapsa sp. ML1]
MSDTLQRIKARKDAALATKQTEAERRAESVRRRAEAAAPLFSALKDVEGELVKVTVLRQIWPEDFHNRDDKARVLLEAYVGDPAAPCGVRLHVPGGHRRFEVEELPDGTLTYVGVRETLGGRPHVASYTDREQWLDAFYNTMASLLEI